MGSRNQVRMPAKILRYTAGWFQKDFLGAIRQMRWNYLPPLMVYFAAGVSGFTGIIESFFVKESLGLNPAFLASLGFWGGLPWAQGIYGTQTGLRQVRVGIELQLLPPDPSTGVSPEEQPGVPFFGSAVLYYSLTP